MERDLQIVGFRIGNETYGVINLRGKIIPVMDLRKRFGHTEIRPDKKNRILVVELENKLLGLIVNSASEVLKIPPSEIDAPGSLFADGQSGYVTGVGKLAGRLIILLDISKLLHRPELKRLEEAADTVANAK